MAESDVKSCEECAASVYPEHIEAHKAGYWGGKLLCVHCFARRQHEQVTIGPDEVSNLAAAAAARPLQARTTGDTSQRMPVASGIGSQPFDDEITAGAGTSRLESSATATGSESQEIRMSNLMTSAPSVHLSAAHPPSVPVTDLHRFKRHPNHEGNGAIRCRVFHAKLNDGALHFMEEQINQWIDQSPDVEIKHVNTQVGIFEAKTSEPHLIITLFY